MLSSKISPVYGTGITPGLGAVDQWLEEDPTCQLREYAYTKCVKYRLPIVASVDVYMYALGWCSKLRRIRSVIKKCFESMYELG